MTTHFVVALGGGVASGKSLAASRFVALGVAVYDADQAARDVVQPGSVGLARIVDAFGRSALDAAGALDRRAMRERVFADAAERKRLEAILHPLVRQRLRGCVENDSGAYCVLAIPLLAETWPAYDWADRVLIIDVSESLQQERLMRRDGVDRALALKMIAAQASRDSRRAIASDIVVNDRDEDALFAAIDGLHRRYLELAREKREPRIA